ncbi:MAG TPA: condensation domain-containing protein, partial [Nitrososphaera sp.]|nr:condensation domain-containing protein [Nitrososphaera sp.]
MAERIDEIRQSGKSSSLPFVNPLPRPPMLPLSFAQEGLWFLEQLEAGKAAYSLPAVLHWQGPLDVAALEKSLAGVVARHESLRTRFPVFNGEPVQVIGPLEDFPLEYVDLSTASDTEKANGLKQVREKLECPFQLQQGPLFRTCLVRLHADKYSLLLNMHHIISDGWSIAIFVHEICALYRQYSQGQSGLLPQLSLQYADYSLWQRSWLSGDILEEQLQFWQKNLAGILPILELPKDHARPAVQSFRGAVLPFAFPQALSANLRVLANREGATLYMVLVAVFQLLLSRYSNQEDVVVGSPIAGRRHPQVENLIGFFVNMLPLRTDLSNNPPFQELLRLVKQAALSAFAHQDVPFEKVVARIQPQRDLSCHPIFQVVFALQNVPQWEAGIPGVTLTLDEGHSGTSKFDLSVEVFETPSGLRGKCEYATDLFEPSTIEQMMGHFTRLLEGIVEDGQPLIHELPMLSASELRQIL